MGLPIYTNPVPDSLIAFRSNFELSVAEFKINRDENEDGDLDTDHYKVNPRDFFIPTQESARIVTIAYQGGNLRSTSINGVKMYTVARQHQSLATWLPPKKIRALRKDKNNMERVDLIQDLIFETATTRIKATPDGEFLIASGIFFSEVLEFVLSDDYSKLAFLCADRSVCLHAKYGSHHSLRIPRMGRDMIYDCWSCDLICAASSPDLYRINLEQGAFEIGALKDQSARPRCAHIQLILYALLASSSIFTNPTQSSQPAARSGHVEIVKALLDKDPLLTRKTDKKRQTALHMAVKGVRSEVVKLLLEADAAIVMLPDKSGFTALHIATRKKRAELDNSGSSSFLETLLGSLD
ncbi:hypothetical protein L6452_08744 [Arctium lappa]|uniref:Uncharacterized protein n=1 Tax=Arctium lappa TaxID=4217 RepID=A0ACB9DIL1_ARCLA|nr:hypothetical protein L6452_08744 [Arctium lappa]